MTFRLVLACIIAFLLSTGCIAQNLTTFPPPQGEFASQYITLNVTTHPVRFALSTLQGAKFIGGIGETIVFPEGKDVTIRSVYKSEWHTSSLPVNQIPSKIFRQDFNSIEQGSLREQLEGISSIIFERSNERVGVMKLGDIQAYIAFSPQRTDIMLTSQDKTDFYTDIILHGFSWKEIKMEILKGIVKE